MQAAWGATGALSVDFLRRFLKCVSEPPACMVKGNGPPIPSDRSGPISVNAQPFGVVQLCLPRGFLQVCHAPQEDWGECTPQPAPSQAVWLHLC